MKNDKKNRRNKNSMTQEYDYNQIDDINDDSLMMTSNENNDQYGINNNENNTGNDTVDGIVSIIRIIMMSIITDKIIIRRMIMIGMT